MAADEKRIPDPAAGNGRATSSGSGMGRIMSGGFGRLRRVLGGEAPSNTADSETETRSFSEHTRVLPQVARPTSDLALIDTLLARLGREPESADAVLRELGTTFFPIENGWRSLFTRLIQQPYAQPELKRLALEDYRRYLARREAERATGASPVAQHGPLPVAGTQGFARSADAPAPHLVRLPVGRPVAVRSADETRPFECRLASCLAWVRGGGSPVFAIADYRNFALRDGRNLIGREPSGDIVIEAQWPDVSRRHLMIDVTGTGRLMFTDLSTFGTFVSADAIDEPI